MYCAVLNQTRRGGLLRTNLSTIRPVMPPITMGHGWGNSGIEARIGMKETEVLTLANGIVNENESLTIPRMTNAPTAFQNSEGIGVATYHSRSKSKQRVAADTTTTST